MDQVDLNSWLHPDCSVREGRLLVLEGQGVHCAWRRASTALASIGRVLERFDVCRAEALLDRVAGYRHHRSEAAPHYAKDTSRRVSG